MIASENGKILRLCWLTRQEYIWAMFPIVLTILLYLSVHQSPFPFPDSYDYTLLAENIAKQFRFAYPSETEKLNSSYLRTPGYPVLIALGTVVLGRHGYFLANLICLYGIVIFSIKLGEKWGLVLDRSPGTESIRTRLYWALLFCSSPGLLTCTTVPLTEVSFTFFVIATLYFIISNRILWGGLCLSSATLVRPIGVYLFIPLALWMLWHRRPWKTLLIFLAAANIFPCIWVMRNYLHSGQIFYCQISGFSLLYYKAAPYLAFKDHRNFEEVRSELAKQLPITDDLLTQSDAAHRLGMRLIHEHLSGFCLWSLRNIPHFFMPDISPLLERIKITHGNRGTYDILNRHGPWAAAKHYFRGNALGAVITVVYLVYYAIINLLILMGIWYFIKNRHWEPCELSILLTSYFIIIPLGNLDWRFRIPVLPVYFIFALVGLRWR